MFSVCSNCCEKQSWIIKQFFLNTILMYATFTRISVTESPSSGERTICSFPLYPVTNSSVSHQFNWQISEKTRSENHKNMYGCTLYYRTKLYTYIVGWGCLPLFCELVYWQIFNNPAVALMWIKILFMNVSQMVFENTTQQNANVQKWWVDEKLEFVST